jgi:hypothetical protein
VSAIQDLKELETPGTPLFLFECTLKSGDVQRWSTHKVAVDGQLYLARVLKHNLFELKSSSETATDAVARVSITLANADSFLSAIERNIGWKGSQVTAKFLFFDLKNSVAASDSTIVFRGTGNPPDESTESTLRLTFTNRLNLQRVFLPEIQVQKRCPWTFPATASQRLEAVNGGAKGEFSAFYRCGYSADQTGGVGNLNGATPFTSCDFTRAQCQQRGMFDTDSRNNVTRRFGGIEFVPASVIVRSYGEKGSHVSTPLDNQARYNDFVPLLYGTGWYQPPVVFARNDGNLTRFEVLLGAGEIADVAKVIVSDIEIPVGIAGSNMTATGWYSLVSPGTRGGSFNPDFSDSAGHPLGDPYGSMAFLSVVVPNRISDGHSVPSIKVLVQGLKLPRFDSSGTHVDDVFTNNPAWVLLDVLRRSGWRMEEVDLGSFASIAPRCDALVHTTDLNGTDTLIPRYQCNLLLTKRRSAADVVRGIRNGSGLYLTFNASGLLHLNAEDTVALQQPAKPQGSNSTELLNGGWPAYEFGDNAFSGLLRRDSGEATLRVFSRSAADTPNRFTVEFQDEFNEYQQDSLSLVDIDDVLLCGQDITVSLTALGLPNFDQAQRATALQLYKSVLGNTYIEFETSVKAVGLEPGDLITLTYSKEGFDRQLFRITKMSPAMNFRTAVITAQIHEDSWYTSINSGAAGLGRQPGFEVGLPRPLVGGVLDSDGTPQFAVSESSTESSDASITIDLSVGFSVPERPTVTSVGIPLVGLNPQVDSTGGTLAGGQTLYYGISAVDVNGEDSGLSFTVKASIPAATNTNLVTLRSLNLSSSARGFHVYRGANPSQLLRIAENAPVAAQFVDSGLPPALVGPPDYNYDHANFYWRLELQPEAKVDIHSTTSIGNASLNMLPNELKGATARLTQGTGGGQERTIAANTSTTLTLVTKWAIEPDASSSFLVADSTWQFGASSNASPVSFAVPNREGATIHVSGRAANVLDEENAFELSPLTRWRILGAAGSSLDGDIPGLPTFGLSATGRGLVEVSAIGFASLTNTRTISAGTLTLAYWNELNGPSSTALNSAMSATDVAVGLANAISVQPGDLIQIESEVMIVQQAVNNATSCQVARGSYGSTAIAHASQQAVYLLEKKTFIMPFARDFFGSPASGSYAYPVAIPDVRIATAELFLTNSRGNSNVARRSFAGTVDLGLRTLSGGQFSIQVEGSLAIQTDAAPPLLVESAHSVRDVFAVVKNAPIGAPIEMRVTQNGQQYCLLTIPAGATISNIVDGFSLGPLQLKARIGLDITAVTHTADITPGRDLTVTIRL